MKITLLAEKVPPGLDDLILLTTDTDNFKIRFEDFIAGVLVNTTVVSHSDWPVGLTVAELAFLDGVTSSIQDQFDTHTHDHGAITGLGDDDHTQYALADGTRDTFFSNYSFNGELELSVGTARWYPPRNCTLNGLEAWVSTAPTGAAVNISVNKNGVELVTGIIADGTFVMTPQTSLGLALLTTDYLTVDIDQIGSTVIGDNLTIRMTIS